MTVFLDFEKEIAELESKIDELRHLDSSGKINIVDEITRLQKKADKIITQVYSSLTPWQKVKVARHPERPQFLHYAEGLFEDFTILAGDRCFAEDQAIVINDASVINKDRGGGVHRLHSIRVSHRELAVNQSISQSTEIMPNPKTQLILICRFEEGKIALPVSWADTERTGRYPIILL